MLSLPRPLITHRVLRCFIYFGVFVSCLAPLSCVRSPQPMLRIATNVWPGYEMLYLARSLDLYQDAPIRLVEMPSASQSLHAIRNGIVEAAALTLDEALNLMQDPSLDLRVILVMDVSNGADALLGRGDLVEVQQLRGKRVGVENTATGAVVLDAALERAGLHAEDIVIVPKTVNDHLAAWKNQEIDALITFEPVRSSLLAEGAHELFNSSQIPGRILDVLLVRADAIEAHRASLKKLVGAYFAAQDYLRQQPDDAAKRMAPRLAVSPQEVLAMFKGLGLPDLSENRRWLAAPAPALHKVATDLAALMRRHDLLQTDVKTDFLAESGFLPDAPP